MPRMVEQAKGGTERAEKTAVKSVPGKWDNKKRAKVGQSNHHSKQANQGYGPTVWGELGRHHHPHIPEKEEPFAMTQAPRPLSTQGEATKGEPHCFTDAYTGTTKATDHPTPKKIDQQ